MLFIGFAIPINPKLNIVKKIASKENTIFNSCNESESNQTLCMTRVKENTILSIVVSNRETDKSLPTIAPFFKDLSIAFVKKRKKTAKKQFKTRKIISITYLGNHHCNVIMKFFIAIVFHNQIHNIIYHFLW